MRDRLLPAVLAAAAAALPACRMENPWAYDPPPAVNASNLTNEARTGRTAIAVLPLANPTTSPLPWSNIGLCMSEALRRALLHQTDFHVEIVTDAKIPVASDDKKTKKSVEQIAATFDDDHVD